MRDYLIKKWPFHFFVQSISSLFTLRLLKSFQGTQSLMNVSAKRFLKIAKDVSGDVNNSKQHDSFRYNFGIGPLAVSVTWIYVSALLPEGACPQHLLWALLFLKLYNSTHVLCRKVGVDYVTFQNWTWIVVEAISRMKYQFVSKVHALFYILICTSSTFSLQKMKIKWDNRLREYNGSSCKVSVDGTDFRIQEPSPFSKSWYSHKFR